MKYKEVSAVIEKRIYDSIYNQGDKLPSIRVLTNEFDCSKSTIVSALNLLKDKGLVYVKNRSGYFVLSPVKLAEEVKQTRIGLSMTCPDARLFPYEDFHACINQAIEHYKTDLFKYGTPEGLISLIKVVRKLLTNYQIFVEENQIVITSGVQQALSILFEMSYPNKGDTILIEQPTYHLVIQQLTFLGYKVKGIERDFEGIDLEELETIFQTGEIKCFYLMPRFHNPLGCSLTVDQKIGILALAKQYNVFLIEDDFMADYETNLKVDPLYCYDIDRSHTIYLKSFSKVIFPGLRVGAAVLPTQLEETFKIRRVFSTLETSMVSQAALEVYIKNGMFLSHTAKMRLLYLDRAKQLHRSLREHSAESSIIKYTEIKSVIIHHCIELSAPVAIAKLKAAGVDIISISENYLLDYKPKRHYLRLNVSNIESNYIDAAIIKLVSVLKNRY